MKLAHVEVCGFRGYRDKVRFDFSPSFTVIDGRNGAGKSTIFDAVEFALTGTISKYLEAKSAGESVADYIWWTGNHGKASDRYVDVGFTDENKTFVVRRTPIETELQGFEEVKSRLVDTALTPNEPIHQLCNSTIIRDEHIARMSLDMKEGDRFALLRNALGAINSQDWIDRGKALQKAAAEKTQTLEGKLDRAKQGRVSAMQQLDQARAAIPRSSLIGDATQRLQELTGRNASTDQMPDLARNLISELASQMDKIGVIKAKFSQAQQSRQLLPELAARITDAKTKVENLIKNLEKAKAQSADIVSSTILNQQAKDISELARLGREIGRHNDGCPLCGTNMGQERFEQGLAAAITLAKRLDSQSVAKAEIEQNVIEIDGELSKARTSLEIATSEHESANSIVKDFEDEVTEFGIDDVSIASLDALDTALKLKREAVERDLRIVDTFSLNQSVSRARQREDQASQEIAILETKLGQARLGEQRTKALFDASRRAAAETLDLRLQRVLPLMAELYKRLRPHPIWEDIEYKLRGDVQRFLRLQVGEEVNPQFVFSSGQRRATGLAFLLSVNLSIAWSRWKSVLLDDPVQHVDDFRTVHLAEVLGHLCDADRQIICAVEDSALADLICRRLPATNRNPGKRITLGTDQEGSLSIVASKVVKPMENRVLVLPEQSKIA